MPRLLKIFVLCLVMTINYCCAQTFNTPEVSSFKQEVFRPFSYYTGQANISIPLTQVQTNEITVPIALSYVGGAGLQPINTYSSVGMGWRVTAGGAITRTMNNIPDEILGATNGISGIPLNGFFNLPPNTVTNETVRSNLGSYIVADAQGKSFSPPNEYSPDVFSFSFLGYSGYFVMGYDGQFKIQSQDIVSVEKGSTGIWAGGYNTVTFKLTANDGTVFTFGSERGSIEASGGNGEGVPFQADAWYITEIKSVNGRAIKFKYQDNAQTAVRFRPTSETPAMAIYPVVLDYIEFNGGKVVFTSAQALQYIDGNAGISTSRMINKIELKDSNNNLVSSSTFAYVPGTTITYTSNESPKYYFLDKLVVDAKPYSFEYYKRNALPALEGAFGQDYWGFYNSAEEVKKNAIAKDASYWDRQLNSVKSEPRRMPSLESAKRGVLTQITYPTGGTEVYEYELNTYSKKGVQKPTGRDYGNTETGLPKPAGGLRVSKITLGDMVRKYKYVNSFDPNNPDNPNSESSGILYKSPGLLYFNRTVLRGISIEGEPPVVYGKVIESLVDKSYTEYTMRSPLNYPDRDDTANETTYNSWFSDPSILGTYSISGFVGNLGKGSSKSLERGQVSLMRVFDAGNNLKKQVAYTYATDPNRFDQNVAVLNIVSTADQSMALLGLELGFVAGVSNVRFSVFNSYQVYTYPVYLEQEIETVYESGNALVKTTEYKYNSQKLRSEISFTNSTNENIKTNYCK